MDVSTITSFISSLGFPIVMCLIMMKYIKEQSDRSNETIKDIMQQHREETTDFKVAIDNNTKAIQMLTEKVERLEKN